jgi:hypothetical protein
MAGEPSAAEALWPHLPKQVPERPAQQRASGSLAETVWPELVQKPPPPRNPNREKLLRGLRTLSERLAGVKEKR